MVLVRNPVGIKWREKEGVWARYAGHSRKQRWVYLAKGRNMSPKTQKNDYYNAIFKFIKNG